MLEQNISVAALLQGPARLPAITENGNFAELHPSGGPSDCKNPNLNIADQTGTVHCSFRCVPTLNKLRDSYDYAGRGMAREYVDSESVIVAGRGTSRSTPYVMAARQCKVCRYGGGICQPGFKKVHVRDDPQCRLHGATGRMNQRLTVPYQPPSPTPSGGMAQRAETPLDQKTAFRTQEGMHLLFKPEASDEWMQRSIETCEGGGYVDTASGEPLNSTDEAANEVYRQRLCERHRIGEQADRLARIMDQYLPDIAGENRAYIMRFPHKVSVMLPKARALRRRIRRKLKMRRGEKVKIKQPPPQNHELQNKPNNPQPYGGAQRCMR